MSAQKSALVRLLAAVVFLSASLACTISSAGTNGSNPGATGQAAPALSDFPEFSNFGDLATVLSNPITVAVGPQAGQVALDHGVKLVIPAGAFPTANQLQVVRIDVAFDHVAPDVSRGNYYLISAREEVPALGAPLLLEIPTTTVDFTVVQYDGSSWQPVQVSPAKTIQISIGHFSWSIWGFFEWWSSRDLQLGQTLDSMDSSDPSSKIDKRIENGDENVHAFFGVNEQASQTQEDMCLDIQSLLEQYNTTDNRKFPSTSASYDDMVKLLQDGSAPSDTGGPYWKLTENSMETINDRVLATTGQLSPAALLKIAIDANNGNIPLGVLAAHNYLKNITYLGRLAFDKTVQVPAQYGEPASHLASWRQSDNIVPATGVYDKMGPVYHIFAAMAGALWLPTKYAGSAIGGAEMYLRTFRRGGDRPDPSKAEADQCGIDSADWLRFHPASDQVPAPTNTEPQPKPHGQQITVTGTMVPVGIDPGLNVTENTISINFRDDGQGQVSGAASYKTSYTWEKCNVVLPSSDRWELTGSYDPNTRSFNGTGTEYGAGGIAYTDCSTGDVPEYKAYDITWEATLKEGVVSGTIYILHGNGISPQVQMTFEAR